MSSDEEFDGWDPNDTTLYCVCRQRYQPGVFMIECDKCGDWFHGSCVGVSESQSVDIDTYHCPPCTKLYGPLKLKPRLNCHRHNFSDPSAAGKSVQAGTFTFVKQLQTRHFPSADEVLLQLRGEEVTMSRFERHGFNNPIVVNDKRGLGIVLPPSNITIRDIEGHIGPDHELDVIDVTRQEDFKMQMKAWCQYYRQAPAMRLSTLNVISLEFSDTTLSPLVEPPKVVRQLDWIEQFWPHDEERFPRPKVRKYCLMSTQSSYTDFHVDFGGSSVWYHVFRGEKVFYLIRPTEQNLTKFEEWNALANSSELFFADMVDKCYKCRVLAGQTLFIPTGWIHAVLTPVDSLVFGGNFLHRYGIPLQLWVYGMELRLDTPDRFHFPHFEMVHWFVAYHLLKELQGYQQKKQVVPVYLRQGLQALWMALKSWSSQQAFKHHRHEIPEIIPYTRVVRDLASELKRADGCQGSSSEKKSVSLSSEKKTVGLSSKPPYCESNLPTRHFPATSPFRDRTSLSLDLQPPTFLGQGHARSSQSPGGLSRGNNLKSPSSVLVGKNHHSQPVAAWHPNSQTPDASPASTPPLRTSRRHPQRLLSTNSASSDIEDGKFGVLEGGTSDNDELCSGRRPRRISVTTPNSVQQLHFLDGDTHREKQIINGMSVTFVSHNRRSSQSESHEPERKRRCLSQGSSTKGMRFNGLSDTNHSHVPPRCNSFH